MDANKLDVDALFKQYTIKEIQTIDVQVKNEIEKKKEDLRIMVYNRYRDIIVAADGIHVMKNCTKKIENILDNLLVSCDTLFRDKENAAISESEKQRQAERARRNTNYVLAVIIKILQNSPSRIWYHLDNEEYLKAAKQYLLAQHAHVCLDLEKQLKSQENSASYIQYANELWTSIVFLSSTILNRARSTLFSSSPTAHTSARVLIEAISAIYLLENVTLEQIFQQYLSTRTPLIYSTLTITDSSVNIKDRVIDCLRAFCNSASNLYYLFAKECDIGEQDFEMLIRDGAFTVETLKDDGFVLSKIPIFLKNVKFKGTESFKRFDTDFMRVKCSEWLSVCFEQLKQGISSALKYASNLKSLVLIRDAVVQFESTLVDESTTSASASPLAQSPSISGTTVSWSHICLTLFGKSVELWSELVVPFYYAQAKQIIDNSFQLTLDNMVRNLNDTLRNKTFETSAGDHKSSPEADINSYMWSTDHLNLMYDEWSSISSSAAATAAAAAATATASSLSPVNESSKSGSSGLRSKNAAKHYATTPAIVKLCKSLDDDLSRLLSDIEFSSRASSSPPPSASAAASSSLVSPGSTPVRSLSVSSVASPVKLKAQYQTLLDEDLKSFSEYLQTSLGSFNQNLNDSLRSLLDKHKADLHEMRSSASSSTSTLDTQMKKILLICRLVHALPNICPNFKLCFNNLYQQRQQQSLLADSTQLMRKKFAAEAKNTNVDQNWSKMEDKFRDITKSCFNVWIDHLCRQISDSHLKSLGSDSAHVSAHESKIQTPNLLLINDLIAWDEIEIDDEIGEIPASESNAADQSDTTNLLLAQKGNYKSKLSVPMVCSPLIQTILYTLCQQITKNLSYNIIDANLIIKDLIHSMFKLIIHAFKNLIKKHNQRNGDADNGDADAISDAGGEAVNDNGKIHLTQNQALQMLFDVKFLYALFDMKSASSSSSSSPSKESSYLDEYKELCGDLEALVDPFDYDICTPFMQSNIAKAITRTASLYGVLNINDRLLRSTSSLAGNLSSSNDKFNLFLLSSSQCRFELLPLATQQSQQQMQVQQMNNLAFSKVNAKLEESLKKSMAGKQMAESGSNTSGLFGFKWF